MAERKTIHKWFWIWNFEKEERWLNEMAMNGWGLVSVGWCCYTFEKCEPGAYNIRLEMHNADDAYISFMEETGAEYIGRVGKCLFFRKKAEMGQFDIFSDIDSRIKHLNRIGRLLAVIGFLNLGIGMIDTAYGLPFGLINLILAALIMYGLGRIHGKRDALETDRMLFE